MCYVNISSIIYSLFNFQNKKPQKPQKQQKQKKPQKPQQIVYNSFYYGIQHYTK